MTFQFALSFQIKIIVLHLQNKIWFYSLGTNSNKPANDTAHDNKGLLSFLKEQPLAEINISIPILNGNITKDLHGDGQIMKQMLQNKDRPLLGLELFPDIAKSKNNAASLSSNVSKGAGNDKVFNQTRDMYKQSSHPSV